MKKVLAFLLAILLFLVSACGTKPQETATPEQTSSAQASKDWIVADIAGNVTAQTSVKETDDFHVAVNKDWLTSVDMSGGTMQVSSFTERAEEVKEEILALLRDSSQTSMEAKLTQQFYNTYLDMKTRNAQGMEPVKPLIEDIENIKTLEDLTDYLVNNKDKMASAPMSTAVMADFKDSRHNAVYIDAPEFALGDADEYAQLTAVGERKKAAESTLFQKLLQRVGYTQEEAQKIDELAFSLETSLASVCDGQTEQNEPGYTEKIYHPVTLKEMEDMSPAFPIAGLLKDFTEAGVDRFILCQPDWLSKVNELYTEENLEALKAYMLKGTLEPLGAFLDQECLNLYNEYTSAIAGTEVAETVEDMAYTYTNSLLDMAVGKMYAEAYVSPETKKNVENMIADVVAVYRKRLENTEWLSEATRQKAIEKLDNLTVRVGYPEDWSLYDYSDISFVPKEEGGSLLTYLVSIRDHSAKRKVAQAASEVDSNLWSVSPQTVNAFYRATDNSINVPAAILGGVFYDPEASEAEQMGSLGMIIGHEITHGFDSNGSQYDKDGNLSNWWTEEDRAAFNERTQKVADYFSQFEVVNGAKVNGQMTIGETVADLGGISCMMEIARGMENFDYAAFFKSYAHLWRTQTLAQIEELILQSDVHPPGYLRTNAIVQQFQEFYDTFGVKEGDGMYLAPEERLSVW